MTAPQQPYQATPPGYGQMPPPAPAKRRKVWPWVLLGAVMVPILMFVACTAMVGAGISAVDAGRKGGTVAIGQEFSYASGLKIAVAAPTPHNAKNQFIVGPEEKAFQSFVTITNNTDKPVGATLITMNATVNSAPAERIFNGIDLPTQDIAPGQQLRVPFRFKVAKDTSGPLQIAVTDTFNEPVFFTGSL